jgi:hypothetical protein
VLQDGSVTDNLPDETLNFLLKLAMALFSRRRQADGMLFDRMRIGCGHADESKLDC